MNKRIRIGVLISGGGTNLQAIIDGCENGTISGQVVFVGSDNPCAAGLDRATRHGIARFVVDYSEIIHQYKTSFQKSLLPQDYNRDEIISKQSFFPADADADRRRTFFNIRAMAEAALLHHMQPYSFDLLVLAGFRRHLTPYFIDRVNTDRSHPRIMNIHPALLPAFPGGDGYGDTFRYGCKVGGCTVHFIDYGEDSGPIIAQRCFTIDEQDTIDSIRAKGLKLEWELYPQCIQLYAHGRLKTIRTVQALPNGKTMSRTIVRIAP